MKKHIKLLLTLIISVMFIIPSVNAASGSVTVSSNSSRVVVGSTVTYTVTMKSSDILGVWDLYIGYDSNKLKLVSGDTSIKAEFGDAKKKSVSYTYKFKTIATGSAKVWVKSTTSLLDYKTDKAVSLSKGSKTITIITQAQLEESYSKNNDLKALGVTGYTLSPKFDKDVTNYTVEAGANIESVKVTATKADSKARVSGTGTHEVSEGENKINVKVTAENGSVKTYTIMVNVIDPNPINVTINDKKYVVVKRESNLTTPEDFEKKKITINDQEIPAFYNETNDYTLVGLKDEEGNIGYYLYDKEKDTYSPYSTISLNKLKIIPFDIDIEIDGYKEKTIKINDYEVKALKYNNSEYSVIKARNFDTGEDNYYRYDEETNTIIRYTDEELKPLKDKVAKYEELIMLLAIESIIVFLILICIIIKDVKKNKIIKRLKREFLKQQDDEIKKETKKDIKEQIKEEVKEEIKEEIIEKLEETSEETEEKPKKKTKRKTKK